MLNKIRTCNYISKLFKFIVHVPPFDIVIFSTLFQNFSSLQFILCIFFLPLILIKFQNFSSLQFILLSVSNSFFNSTFQNFSSLQFIFSFLSSNSISKTISKLFKFTVHVNPLHIRCRNGRFQNFSSLQFIKEIVDNISDGIIFQNFSSLQFMEKLEICGINVVLNFKTFQVYSSFRKEEAKTKAGYRFQNFSSLQFITFIGNKASDNTNFKTFQVYSS